MSMITAGDEVALANVAAPFETGSMKGRMTVDGTVVAYVQTPAICQDGEVVYVQLYENLSSVQENLAALRIVLILVNVVVVIPVLISGRFLSDLIVKPIQT